MAKKVKESLVRLGKRIVKQVHKKENPAIDVPIRALSNIIFDKKTRTLKLGDKVSRRFFFNIAHAKKFLQTIEIAAVSKSLMNAMKHASLRDVYYMVKRTIPKTKVNLVDEQSESDSVIEDLELVLDEPRENLHINANKNGSVSGDVVVEDKGDVIDWSKMGSGGWSVPSNVENIKFKKVKAEYVLYMEKAAVWERLHEDRFWDKQNCIIICSQGQATRGVRRLLQRLYSEYKLPIYVLTDLDPWGLYIYSVLKFGSISLAHISEKLAIPDIKYLGITVDDIKDYRLQKHLIRFKDTDRSRLKQISKYEWFGKSKEWQRQFKLMKELDAKAEIQALSSRGISFISEKYLPEKIKKKDFLD